MKISNSYMRRNTCIDFATKCPIVLPYRFHCDNWHCFYCGHDYVHSFYHSHHKYWKGERKSFQVTAYFHGGKMKHRTNIVLTHSEIIPSHYQKHCVKTSVGCVRIWATQKQKKTHTSIRKSHVLKFAILCKTSAIDFVTLAIAFGCANWNRKYRYVMIENACVQTYVIL